MPFSHLGKREGINNENCGDVVFGALNYIKQKKPIVSSLLVPVISLIAYIFLSAGQISFDCEITAQLVSFIFLMNRFRVNSV